MEEQKSTPPKYPFDDDSMKYDHASHRYVLTEQGVFTELGEKLDMRPNSAGDTITCAIMVVSKITQGTT